jgi:hypothetical protein
MKPAIAPKKITRSTRARGAAKLKLLWRQDDTREAGPTTPQLRAQSKILARLSA